MRTRRDYQQYPTIYRAREMKAIVRWIQAGESGSIIGLAGGGKSNFMGFFCHRPEVLQSYLPEHAGRVVPVLVDLNNLPSDDLATLYRVMLRSLYEARDQFAAIDESLSVTIEQHYRKVEDKTDPFLSQSALREVLFSIQQYAIRLVMVMDRFDQFCRKAAAQVLDNIRGLRDTFKHTLSYLVGLRHPLAYLRSPVELAELYEILDIHHCWLGAMAEEDARWVIGQVESSMSITFDTSQVEQLVYLTGGYPALLRAASLWLARQSQVPPLETWETCLSADKSINNRLDEIWQGLTGEEEAVLPTLSMALNLSSASERRESLRQIEELYQSALTNLVDKGLCLKTEEGWRTFSPLFARFAAGVESTNLGKIWRTDLNINRFFRGEKELNGLKPQDHKLLHFFFNHLNEQPFSLDAIKDGAWPDDYDEGISDMTVQQAIRQLRKSIEANPAKPRYVLTERGLGYRFYPEGAPRD